MGEARHLVTLGPSAVVAVGEGDAQDLGGCNGIFAVGLVEVSATEEHHGIRVLRLQIEELLHHRGQFPVFLRHYFWMYFMMRSTISSSVWLAALKTMS